MSSTTDPELTKLLDLAIEAKKNAYAPYSNFRVGCSIKTSTGKIFTGCNVENSSYGLSICAERCCIFKAVSEGEKKLDIVVVSTDLKDVFASPCGACRQVISEFGSPDVYLVKPDKTFKKVNIDELLPLSFKPEHLDIHKSQS